MASGEAEMQLPPVDAENMALLMGVGTLLKDKQIDEYSIAEQRDIFRKYQSTPERNTGIAVRKVKVETSHGEVDTYLYRSSAVTEKLAFVYYIHGGGWILGSAADWAEFLFDLAERTQLAIVFPEYTLAPEKQYPTQQEQCVEVLQHILRNGEDYKLHVDTVVIACDSVGAQLASAVSIINHQRILNLPIVHQFLLQPFVHTSSTVKMVEMPLTNLAWTEQYYAAYFPASTDRYSILASPDLMTEEQAKNLMPPTTVVTSEIDGLRDQGEAFAKMLQMAGVKCGVVRALGCLHAAQIFRQARDSPSAQLIMDMMSGQLRRLSLV